MVNIKPALGSMLGLMLVVIGVRSTSVAASELSSDYQLDSFKLAQSRPETSILSAANRLQQLLLTLVILPMGPILPLA
jgi:hypothetical protein